MTKHEQFNILVTVLQKLIDLHEQTQCGCEHPACRKCRDDRAIESTIAMGLRSDDPLDDIERKQFEVLKKMFFHTIPDRMPDTYFISGEAGEKNTNGLPEYVSICPAYGVGFSVLYKRVDHDVV